MARDEFSSLSNFRWHPRFLMIPTYTDSERYLQAADSDATLVSMVPVAPFRRTGTGTSKILLMKTCSYLLDGLLPLSLIGFSYGAHPIYIEHRFNETTKKSSSSGVLLLRYVTSFMCHVASKPKCFKLVGSRHLPPDPT